MVEDSYISSSSSSEDSPSPSRRRISSRGRRRTPIADKENLKPMSINPSNSNSNSKTRSQSKSKSKSKSRIKSRRSKSRNRSRRQILAPRSNHSRNTLRNRSTVYDFDDVSDLHCDEYGYDRKSDDDDDSSISISNSIEEEEDDDDDNVSVEGFFQAPTKQELSKELFQLVHPQTKASEALDSLFKLRQWGKVADNDPNTMNDLVELQAVPTLFYFVRASLEKRRSLKQQLVQRLVTLQSHSNKQRGTEFRTYQEAYVKASSQNEMGLQQALQLIHRCTNISTTSNNASNKNSKSNKKKSLHSLELKKANLAQLVDIDGVDSLVHLLQEQLPDLVVGPKHNHKNTNFSPAVAEYGHSICKSIWLILMNVGACDHAIQFLKEMPHNTQSKETSLIHGISMGLDHRFKVAASDDRTLLHIMPEYAMSTGIDCHKRNRKKQSPSTSWMEDLFVALCRLVASKDAEHLDPNNPNHQEHDEARMLAIQLKLVSKCLRALLDERNTVLGQDPFVTTLALSFFYACLRFRHRYTLLQQLNPSTPQLLEESLAYPKLVQFTLISVRSFPSHHLIQGTGCFLLEAIPEQFRPTTTTIPLAQECLALATEPFAVVHNTCIGDEMNLRSMVSVNEQCQWYF